MMLLVSGATKTVKRFSGSPHIGQLATPRDRNAIHSLTWAADNSAFSGFDEDAFVRMLETLQGTPGCLWVAAPDVVGNAAETLALFDVWEPAIRRYGFPVALVAQDGLMVDATPWGRMDALFVGGSTKWKLGPQSFALMTEARRRGLWVHVGRVNTRRRMDAVFGYADSIDGSQFSRFPDTHIPWAVRKLASQSEQSRMF